jgi:hypothetical protein
LEEVNNVPKAEELAAIKSIASLASS